MGFKDVLKKSFLEGFTAIDITAGRMVATFAVVCALSLYIFIIYRVMTRKSFYSKGFNVSLAGMSIITAAIILAMQSNLVISLGMVGALSIVRFRTAIKDPMDLVFLFWSISIGIICGAGLFEIAVLASVIVTIMILVLENLPTSKAPLMLVVNLSDMDAEKALLDTVKQNSKVFRIKSRNIARGQMDLVIEVRAKDETELAKAVAAMKEVSAVSLIAHDGEVTF